MPSAEKVLVLYEQSRGGGAAIDLARELAEREHAALTVVGIAPQAPSGPRCGNSALEYNQAVAASVAQDLDEARERLGRASERTNFQLLIAGAEPSLQEFAQIGGFDLVLLPARRRPLRGRGGSYHPEASRLRLIAGAEIRLVAPGSR
ncbi:MAG: universal stress protein [Solirubrobacterales bacterium]|nr:universal stress protein [Solirubrobacterales bacterium]